MKIKQVLITILIIIFLFPSIKCEGKEITISGQIIMDSETGIPETELTLIITKKTAKGTETVIKETIKTNGEGNFTEQIPVPRDVLKNPQRYNGKIELDSRFWAPSEKEIDLEKVDLKEMKLSSINIEIESYGGAIRGKVVNKGNNSIFKAKISLLNVINDQEKDYKYTFSNENGEFSLYCIRDRNLSLKIEHQLYKTYKMNIAVKAGIEEDIKEPIVLEEKDPPTFNLPLSIKDFFRIGTTTAEMREIFREKASPPSDDKATLSDKAMVVTIKESSPDTVYKCEIRDLRGTRTIISYNIYQMEPIWLWVYREEEKIPGGTGTGIPDDDGRIEIALNSGNFPEELRNRFRELELPLPQGIEIIKEGYRKWIIGGEGELHYLLIKFENKIYICNLSI